MKYDLSDIFSDISEHGKKKTVGISDWCGGSFIVYNIFTKARVTAWMPRPKPYEEEENEESD